MGCTRNLSNNKNHPILNLLNVKYVLTSYQLNNSGFKLVFDKEGMYVYENEDVLPKAFIVHDVKVLSEDDALKELKGEDFNPMDAVILEQEIKLNEYEGNLGGKRPDAVKIEKYTPNEISVKVNITEPAFLVLSEVYYPEWSVYVDGEKQMIYRAYHALRAVYLDVGPHEVRFVYEPYSLGIGSWITFLTSVFLVVIISIKLIPKSKNVKEEQFDR
jgi:uncharacterized membrane protein YfhO